jgi:hypothetical protein
MDGWMYLSVLSGIDSPFFLLLRHLLLLQLPSSLRFSSITFSSFLSFYFPIFASRYTLRAHAYHTPASYLPLLLLLLFSVTFETS